MSQIIAWWEGKRSLHLVSEVCEYAGSIKVRETHRKTQEGKTVFLFVFFSYTGRLAFLASLSIGFLKYFPNYFVSYFLLEDFNLIFSFIILSLKLYPFYCIHYASYSITQSVVFK